ncbi:MAG: response regulator transcription factor [Betaproteobacteria bacterium]|nr:response regulator transcription factor [Betaproteobacteria bacterium]MDE2047928.1 response regulator transcription factor [Betaproteobacteria bacterium]
MDRIRTIIIEDLPEVRLRLREELQQDARIAFVGEAMDVASGCRLVDEHRVDVALVDLGLPDGSGLQVIKHLVEVHPQADAMVISVFGEEETVFKAIEAGATGYLIKGSLDTGLGDAIVNLRSGGSPISPLIARRLLKRFQHNGDPAAPAPAAPAAPVTPEHDALSEREMSVLKLVAQGFVVNEIAEKLFISPHTVATHVKHIYRKLQVRSRGQAVNEAIKRGLLRP